MAATTCTRLRLAVTFGRVWSRKSDRGLSFRKRDLHLSSNSAGRQRQQGCLTLSHRLFLQHVKSSRRHLNTGATGVSLRENPEIQLPQNVRTDKSDPADHTLEDAGLFYTIPKENFALLCPEKGNGKAYRKGHKREITAFNETAFMIRKPALEVINYMKHADYSTPVQRYLFYGCEGTGRSVSLQHVAHYCLRQGWLIVPTPQACDWIQFKTRYKMTQREEILESQWKEGRWDQPVRATAWLENFKIVNKEHLDKIKTSREYIWTKRERTEAGVPLGSLVDHGIARARISTDVIGCIMKELRTQPESILPRVLVMVDDVGALFHRTYMKARMGVKILNETLTFTHNLRKMIKNSWCNGAVVMATGRLTNDPAKTYYELGHAAFDLLDPHIPVEVPFYSDSEVLSQMAYYEDRKWLTGRALTADGKMETTHLCCNNPLELAKICGSLY